jgi:excisionase family DNA binding protein
MPRHPRSIRSEPHGDGCVDPLLARGAQPLGTRAASAALRLRRRMGEIAPRAEPVSEIQPLLVSVRRAAPKIGVGRDTAYQLVREGRLRSVRIGRRILIPVAECAAFVERESK